MHGLWCHIDLSLNPGFRVMVDMGQITSRLTFLSLSVLIMSPLSVAVKIK